MTARPMRAAFDCVVSDPQGGPPSVEQVAERAGVARRTFCERFASSDVVVERQADALVEAMIAELKR